MATQFLLYIAHDHNSHARADAVDRGGRRRWPVPVRRGRAAVADLKMSLDLENLDWAKPYVDEAREDIAKGNVI